MTFLDDPVYFNDPMNDRPYFGNAKGRETTIPCTSGDFSGRKLLFLTISEGACHPMGPSQASGRHASLAFPNTIFFFLSVLSADVSTSNYASMSSVQGPMQNLLSTNPYILPTGVGTV